MAAAVDGTVFPGIRSLFDSRGNVAWILESRTSIAPAAPVERRLRNFYDPVNRLVQEREFTGTHRRSTQWQYDRAGNRTLATFQEQTQPATPSLSPSAANPLWPQIWQETCTYGPAPGPAHADSTYTPLSGAAFGVAYAPNQLRRTIRTGSGAHNTHYHYDARGNRLGQKRTTGGANQWTVLTWDPQDRLIAALVSSGGTPSQYSWKYDYRSRRTFRSGSGQTEVIAFSGGTS